MKTCEKCKCPSVELINGAWLCGKCHDPNHACWPHTYKVPDKVEVLMEDGGWNQNEVLEIWDDAVLCRGGVIARHPDYIRRRVRHEQLKGKAQMDFLKILAVIVRKYGHDSTVKVTQEELATAPRGGLERDISAETGTLTYRFVYDTGGPPKGDGS